MLRIFFLGFLFSHFFFRMYAEDAPDTVKVGIYINSIHDIDFRQKEYTTNLWLWLTYHKKEFDFSQYLEVPQAKTVTKSFFNTDTTRGRIFMIMKLQCVMKDSWKISSFPFDRQRLRFAIENSQYDANDLVFVADTVGKHSGKYTINGWNIDSLTVSTGKKDYETAFGDDTPEPHSTYSTFRVITVIRRDGQWELFLKVFLGMYISFLIAYVCFFIHTARVESRYGLSVGALYAVIGNKYIIDSALPETTSFTLVDTLHGLTLLFILIVIISTTYSLKLVKEDNDVKANRIDKIMAAITLSLYVFLNIYFIVLAH
jgi:hypothetical protein